MKNYAVSIEDIDQALRYTPKDVLANCIALDTLGANATQTEQFARHLAAYKNRNPEDLAEACKHLVIKHSKSITASKGCFLDEKKTIPLDFDGALKSHLENIVASLDSAMTGNNPAVSIITARNIVNNLYQTKVGGFSKQDLSDNELQIEINLASGTFNISPKSKVDESKLMEASPIANELVEAISKLASRRAGLEMKSPSSSMGI